jgi:putative redox protein
MNASATWSHGLSFTGKADTGFEVPLGAGLVLGGAKDGFDPLELLAISLAGCTAMDVISILTKKKQKISFFEVNVHAEQAEEFPKVFTQAVITYKITGHLVEEAAVLRSIELSETKYCPIQAMLGKVVPMEMNYEIYEDEGIGKTKLIKTGEYHPHRFLDLK